MHDEIVLKGLLPLVHKTLPEALLVSSVPESADS